MRYRAYSRYYKVMQLQDAPETLTAAQLNAMRVFYRNWLLKQPSRLAYDLLTLVRIEEARRRVEVRDAAHAGA